MFFPATRAAGKTQVMKVRVLFAVLTSEVIACPQNPISGWRTRERAPLGSGASS
jgi:hypothetical protein